MSVDGLSDGAVRQILLRTRRIVVVGASNKPARPSFGVAAFLIATGFDVTPVNPLLEGQRIHGRRVLGSLEEAASYGPLDMVDIFRVSEQAGIVSDEAVRLGARTVWMQLGVVDQAAATRAAEAGLAVVMDRCAKIEWPRLGLAGRPSDGSPSKAEPA